MQDQQDRLGLARRSGPMPDAPTEDASRQRDLRADARHQRADDELSQRQRQLAALLDQAAARESGERGTLDRAHADLRERVRTAEMAAPAGNVRQGLTRAVEARLDRFSDLQRDALARAQELTREVLEDLVDVTTRQAREESARRDWTTDAHERGLLDRIRTDLQALDACQIALRDQFLQDQVAIERVLYDRRLDDGTRRRALDAALAEQTARHQVLRQQAERLLQHEDDRVSQESRLAAMTLDGMVASLKQAFSGQDLTLNANVTDRKLDVAAEVLHPEQFAAQLPLMQQETERRYSELRNKVDAYDRLRQDLAAYNSRALTLAYAQDLAEGVKDAHALKGWLAERVLEANHIIEQRMFEQFKEEFGRLGWRKPGDMAAVALPAAEHTRSLARFFEAMGIQRKHLPGVEDVRNLTSILLKEVGKPRETAAEQLQAYASAYATHFPQLYDTALRRRFDEWNRIL